MFTVFAGTKCSASIKIFRSYYQLFKVSVKQIKTMDQLIHNEGFYTLVIQCLHSSTNPYHSGKYLNV